MANFLSAPIGVQDVPADVARERGKRQGRRALYGIAMEGYEECFLRAATDLSTVFLYIWNIYIYI